jgi:hypothetical protein
MPAAAAAAAGLSPRGDGSLTPCFPLGEGSFTPAAAAAGALGALSALRGLSPLGDGSLTPATPMPSALGDNLGDSSGLRGCCCCPAAAAEGLSALAGLLAGRPTAAGAAGPCRSFSLLGERRLTLGAGAGAAGCWRRAAATAGVTAELNFATACSFPMVT